MDGHNKAAVTSSERKGDKGRNEADKRAERERRIAGVPVDNDRKAAIDMLLLEARGQASKYGSGVFSRARPAAPKWQPQTPGDQILPIVEDAAARLQKLEKLHDDTGERIDAWQAIPAGSGTAIAEARAIAEVVDQEIAGLDALRGVLSRIKNQGQRAGMKGLVSACESVMLEIESWHKDAIGDKDDLLAAAAAIEGQKAAEASTTGGEVPLPVQVERALADVHPRRERRDEDSRYIKMLPRPEERRAMADKILATIAVEEEQQRSLLARVSQALSAAKEAGVAPPHELVVAEDQLKAWAHGLAFERSRIDSLAK